MSLLYNITGSTGVIVEIVSAGAKSIKSLMLTNVHATNAATVSVFFENRPVSGDPEIYHIIHDIIIPIGTSLFLDETNILKAPKEFSVYVQVGASDTVDVIISN